MDAFNSRCAFCNGFHEYGQCQYHDQGWENQPYVWEVDENFTLWNPPIHQYYGDYQPFEEEEPHQSQGSGNVSLEEALILLTVTTTSFINESQVAQKNQESFNNEVRNKFKNQ